MKRWRFWACMGVLAVISLGVLYYRKDPETEAGFPGCFLYEATGYQCTACGLQRFTHDFLHGNWAAAWQHHAWMMILITLGLAISLFRMVFPQTFLRHWHHPKNYFPYICLTIFIAGSVIFTLIRNI